jgi:hypothetical protein
MAYSGLEIRRGSATLSNGTVTVSDPTITAGSIILTSPVGTSNGGILGVTVSAGNSFTIASLNVLDARTINYIIIG